jgi:hypothetical protein
MEIELLNEQAVLRIKERYGVKQLQRCLAMYGANIPERYWLDFTDKVTFYDLDCFDDPDRWVALVGKMKDINRLINHILKVLMTDKKKDVYFLDFFELMGKPMVTYDQSSLTKVMHELNFVDYVGISNIKAGTLFNNLDEVFHMFLSSLLNTQFKKTVILGIEKPPEGTIQDYYGATGELIGDESLFTLVYL